MTQKRPEGGGNLGWQTAGKRVRDYVCPFCACRVPDPRLFLGRKAEEQTVCVRSRKGGSLGLRWGLLLPSALISEKTYQLVDLGGRTGDAAQAEGDGG